MNNSSRIFIAGHQGLVGSAIFRLLKLKGHHLLVRTRDELDLRDDFSVRKFFEKERPTHVFLAAARVGGIIANSKLPVNFLEENLKIQLNVISESARCEVEKLLFLGSSCIYPKLASQPISEDALLTGPLEPTNEAYAVAKIAGISLCKAYSKQCGLNAFSVMPPNVYGINDNFHSVHSHVVPALMRKIHEAKLQNKELVSVMGTGKPKREFIFSDDLANACVYMMGLEAVPQIVNAGTNEEISIADLAVLIARIIGYEGEFYFDTTYPDGTPRKLLDSSRAVRLGWKSTVPLEDGLRKTYEWYSKAKTTVVRN